jgi:TolB-like protein
MGQAPGSGIYEFEKFRLVAGRRLLSHADGRAIELAPKAFDALLYMVSHPGELLDKAALLKAVWPNVVVEENNLNQVISALRRALGNGAENRFIVTVPGRGYQFVAAVTEAGAGTENAPSREPAPERAGLAAKASIAVLPFASLSGDPEKDYFGDGIAEELIHLLARVPGLKVPARTSSFAYKGRNTDARQIARDLGVGMLLEGSVRSAGDRIRVTAQLIEAESGFHIWSQTYDRQFSDVFELQDELAGAIVQALKINLGGQAPLLRDAPPTRNLEAYRLFLQVRAIWNRSLSVGPMVERIREMLDRVIMLDPGFARAHAQLASVLGTQFTLGRQGQDTLPDIQRSAERALELDPQLASAHMSIGLLHVARGEWLAGDACFRRAIALDPDEPTTRSLYAVMVLGPSGMIKKALEFSHEAYRLGPAHVSSAVTLAGFYSFNERDEEAGKSVEVAVDLGAPVQSPPLPIFRYQAALRARQYDTARDHIMALVPADIRAQGGDDAVSRVFAGLADVRQSSTAVTALRALVKKSDPKPLDNWPMIVLIYNWYAMLGALDDAFNTAQRMVQSFRQTGILNAIKVAPLWLPELRAFRRDPRFGDLVAGLGLLDYWKEHGPPDDCEFRGGRLIVN